MSKVVSIIIAVLIFTGVVAGGMYYFTHRDNTKVTADMLTARLEDASECTTQKLIYQGVVTMSRGSIPFIDKSSFIMTYAANVRAGFDMSAVDVNITDEAVEVTIPKTEIQEITIESNSLEFYDTSFSVFTLGKDAVKEALQKAEADAEAKAGSSGLLEAADENAESLIKGMLVDAAGDREIVVMHKA